MPQGLAPPELPTSVAERLPGVTGRAFGDRWQALASACALVVALILLGVLAYLFVPSSRLIFAPLGDFTVSPGWRQYVLLRHF